MIAGERFGNWVVKELAGTYQGKWPVWWCQCDCGTYKRVKAYTLMQGTSKSCGCAKKGAPKTHGMTESKTYSSWLSMKWRCTTKNKKYDKYVRNGITVCQRWLDSFEAFLEDMGERPAGTTIDRIDNAKGYYKENCRWATQFVQIHNRSCSHKITYLGVTMSITEWAKSIGISRLTLTDRIKRGWPIEKALTTKPHAVTPVA